MKSRNKKNQSRARKEAKRNRTAMIAIILVVCCLLSVLTVRGYQLQKKMERNRTRLSSVEKQIEDEKQRTDDITAMKEYMQTDEYIEKTAREKLGMVKDNEILFKETK